MVGDHEVAISQMTLYSYCIPYDSGAAPNPYWGTCTLVICKPGIRRLAKTGDWVVGLGSAASPIGDISGQVVFAMRVSAIMPMEEYDRFCKRNLRGKIPNWRSRVFEKKVGDCIYDFSSGERPAIRLGVHDERNRRRDLSGENALLSDHFYYFGDHPRPLPQHLRPIIQQTQGYKSSANAPYVEPFIVWIEGLALKPNKPYGDPQLKPRIMADAESQTACSERDLIKDDNDEMCS